MNNNDKKRLCELNRKRNYELIIFYKNEFYLKFSEILKFSDSDRFYQHTLIMLVHFVQEFKKDDFDSSDFSLFLNWILLHNLFDLNWRKIDLISLKLNIIIINKYLSQILSVSSQWAEKKLWELQKQKLNSFLVNFLLVILINSCWYVSEHTNNVTSKKILLKIEQEKIAFKKIYYQLNVKKISEHDILNMLSQAEQQFKWLIFALVRSFYESIFFIISNIMKWLEMSFQILNQNDFIETVTISLISLIMSEHEDHFCALSALKNELDIMKNKMFNQTRTNYHNWDFNLFTNLLKINVNLSEMIMNLSEMISDWKKMFHTLLNEESILMKWVKNWKLILDSFWWMYECFQFADQIFMNLNAKFAEDFSFEIKKLLKSKNEVQIDSNYNHFRTLSEWLRK